MQVPALVRTSGRTIVLHRRLMVGVVAGAVAFVALPTSSIATRLVASWDLGVLVYLVLIWAMMLGADQAELERRADDEDAGALAVLLIAIVTAAVSFGAIGALLGGVRDLKGEAKIVALGLAGATILLSWVFTHTMFTVHYAHDFYAGEDDRRGLNFPGKDRPDYLDFAYFSFTMGAASQTSDVSVDATRMRRFVLLHTIVSFLFNTTVLALAINVGASLM